MDRKHGIGRLTVVGIATALAVACGDEPTAKPTGLAMGGHIAASEATAEGPDGPNRPPLIEKISFSPRSPAPGDRLNSSVTASDPDGDKLELIYRWRVDGRPVTAAMAYVSDHVVGIYGVGTLPEYRRRGFGEAITRAAVSAAPHLPAMLSPWGAPGTDSRF